MSVVAPEVLDWQARAIDSIRRRARNTELNFLECRRGQVRLASLPQHLGIGTTTKCNLECVMCPSRSRPQVDLSPVVLEHMKPCIRMAVDGCWNEAGELFASSRTSSFLAFMRENRTPGSFISTNLLLIDRWGEELIDSGLKDVIVSIDTPERETYEATRVGGSWKRLLDNVRLLGELKQRRGTTFPRVAFTMVVMKRNIDQMLPFVDFAHSHGASAVQFLRLLPTPTLVHVDESPCEEEELRQVEACYRRARELGMTLISSRFSNQTVEELIASASAPAPDCATAPVNEPEAAAAPVECVEAEMPIPALHARPHMRHILTDRPGGEFAPFCPQPWIEFITLADGTVRACCFGPTDIGNLSELTFEQVWNSEEYRDLRRRILLRDYSLCRDCTWLERARQVLPDNPSFAALSRVVEVCEQLAGDTGLADGIGALAERVRVAAQVARYAVERRARLMRDVHIVRSAWEWMPEPDARHRDRPMEVEDAPIREAAETLRAQLRELPTLHTQWHGTVERILRALAFGRRDGVVPGLLYDDPASLDDGAIDAWVRAERQSVHVPWCARRTVREVAELVRKCCAAARDAERELATECRAVFEWREQFARAAGHESVLSNPDPEASIDALFYSARIEPLEMPAALPRSHMRGLPVRVTNTSVVAWPTRGLRSVRLAYSWLDEDGRMVELEGLRTQLPEAMPPFRPCDLNASLRTPDLPGRYVLMWDLVYEKVEWFRDRGAQPALMPMEID
jgi:MoaA/NifB/PqqE/SkfB family radical SAM enzyme